MRRMTVCQKPHGPIGPRGSTISGDPHLDQFTEQSREEELTQRHSEGARSDTGEIEEWQGQNRQDKDRKYAVTLSKAMDPAIPGSVFHNRLARKACAIGREFAYSGTDSGGDANPKGVEDWQT